MLMLVFSVLFIIYLVTCLALVLIILNQEPKGGGLGSMFGQGSALGDAFGVGAMQQNLKKFTRNCAFVFFGLSIVLALLGQYVFSGVPGGGGLLPEAELPPPTASVIPSASEPIGAPAAPTPTAAPGN